VRATCTGIIVNGTDTEARKTRQEGKMANQEHLAILKQGVRVWNEWRKEQPNIRPNLNGADLSYASLTNANLERAILSDAILANAILASANLTNASLNGAHLRNANLNVAHLRNAILSYADLERADLHSANLERAMLSYASLTNANLTNANLTNANLIGAKLNYADLERANLNYADLERANLNGAHLRNTNLTNAILTNANLNGAHLLHADLHSANLDRAIVVDTSFGGVDLSVVKNLETVRHQGPSTIGIDTIIRSQGKIPEIFLRNAGVPNSIIEAIPSLIGSLSPIDYYSCFISYSSKDQDFAERLYADLQSKGVRCWFAPEDLKIGDKLRLRIDESIRLHDKLLLVLSEYSTASQWVEQEVATALARERKEQRTVLFPIRLDNAIMEIESDWPFLIRNTRHIGDFTHWKKHDDYEKAFDRLLRDLKAVAQKMGSRDVCAVPYLIK